MSGPEPAIVRLDAAETRPLRHAVLRPGQPADRLIYPADDDPTTLHLGMREAIDNEADALIAVASFYDEPVPDGHTPDSVPADAPAHRIRGMATHPDHRGRGLGRRLVGHALALLTDRHGAEPALWCNARTTAAGYYARLGFTQLGPEFEIPDIGPHVVMVRLPGDGTLTREEFRS